MTFKRCAHGFDRKRVAAVIVILKGLTINCDDCLIMTGACGGGRRCIDDLFDRRVHFAELFTAHRTAYESFDGMVCVKVIPIPITGMIGMGGRRFVQIDKSDFVKFITKRGNAAAVITVDGHAVLVEVLETAEIAFVRKPLHRRSCEIGQAIASRKTVLTCIIEAAADGDGLQIAASGKCAGSGIGAAGDMVDVVADRDRGQSIFVGKRTFADDGAGLACGSVPGVVLRRYLVGDGDFCVVAVALFESDGFIVSQILILKVGNRDLIKGYLLYVLVAE